MNIYNWRLGFSEGSDGVVFVKSDSGAVRRVVARACVLPIDK